MTSSDFLVLITILLAIISTSVANNKMIWIYKFSKVSIISYIIMMIVINYFIFFSWYEQRGIYVKYFMIKGSPESALILFSIWKIVICKHFPYSNKTQLVNYYKSLINSNINVLIEYLRIYHWEKIEKLVTKINKSYYCQENIPKKDFSLDVKRSMKGKYQKETIAIEAAIFSEVILNKTFVVKSIEVDCLFFLECVHRCVNTNITSFKEAIEVYFRTMIRQKQPCLLEGLKRTVNYKGNSNIEYRLDDSPFLTLLFTKTEFVYNLNVFNAFGEEALRESSLGSPIFSEQTNEWKDDEYQSTAVFQFLCFTDIFIRKLLLYIKDNDRVDSPYLYIYYFKLICSNLVQNHIIPYVGSYTQKYVEDFINNAENWIQVMIKLHIDTFEYNLLEIWTQLAEELNAIPGLQEQGIELASRFLNYGVEIERQGSQSLQEDAQNILIVSCYIDFVERVVGRNKNLYVLAWKKLDKIKDCISQSKISIIFKH